MTIVGEASGAFWYLEGYLSSDRDLWRSVIRETPFVIGRAKNSNLCLASEVVSSRHAEFFEKDERLWLRDLGSTNGTFVNFERLEDEIELSEGDILHFASQELRLAIHRPGEESTTDSMDLASFAGYLAARSRGLLSMIRRGAVLPHFQPVVSLHDGEVLGYELLSRGELGGALARPEELFFLAERLGLERKLSQMFRLKGSKAACRLPGDPVVFLNTHPAELEDREKLIDSLHEIRAFAPNLRFALEVRESALGSLDTIRRLRDELAATGFELAFDDFGHGESRLLELAELSPRYVKFDMSLVKNTPHGSNRWKFLEILVRACDALQITSIAEGIETQDEARACQRIGFEWAQGFLLGQPEQSEVRPSSE